MTAAELPMPMYTVREAEKLAGLRDNTLVIYERKGYIEREKDVCNQWRVTHHSLANFIKMRDAGKIKVGR